MNISIARQDNTLFLGANMGMYAYRITDGALLWHVLDMSDVGFVRAALAN